MKLTTRDFRFKEIIQTLKTLQTKFPSAIIAGGMLRDMYFRKDIKDVDIFLRDPTTSNELLTDKTRPLQSDLFWADLFELELFTTDFHYKKDSIFLKYNGYLNQNIDDFHSPTCVWGMTKNSINYDIIVVKYLPIFHVINYFDINLCKCYTDGKKIHYARDFITDGLNQTITVCDNLTDDDRKHTLSNHVPRLKQKYPNFTVIR